MFQKSKKNPGLSGAMIDFIIPKKKPSRKRKVVKTALGVGAAGAIAAGLAERRAAKRGQ